MARMNDDFVFEASLHTFRDQKEVPKLLQLTPSGQTATELTRNGKGSFIVRLPIDDSKPTATTNDLKTDFRDRQESVSASGMASTEEVKITAETRLCRRRSVNALDWDSGLAGILKACLHAAMARRQVGEIPVHTCLYLLPRITGVKEPDAVCIPLERQNKWQLMHDPTSEIWKRWQSKHLVGVQLGTEKRFSEVNAKEDEQVGPPVQIGSDEEGGSGPDWSRPDGSAAASTCEERAIRSKGFRADNGLRHTCLKAGEYVPVI